MLRLAASPRTPSVSRRVGEGRDRPAQVNVCLGKQFEGGSLFFRGVRCPCHQNSAARPQELFTYEHVRGVALLHRGHHRHGAHAIESGERYNLILWCRAPADANSSERATRGFRAAAAKRQRGANGAAATDCPHWCWMHPESPHGPAEGVGRAARQGDERAVAAWLDEGGGVDAGCAEFGGVTLLMEAAVGGQEAPVRMLLQRGASVKRKK